MHCLVLALSIYCVVVCKVEWMHCLQLTLKNFLQLPDENELHTHFPCQWHRKKKREPGKYVSNFMSHSLEWNESKLYLSDLILLIEQSIVDH
jgi:hypothetical protein